MTRRYPSGSIPPLRAALTALAALLFLSRAALAQGGVTVDRWQLVPGQAAEARGITADPFGSLYAAGSAYENGSSTGRFIVRKRASGVSSFEKVDEWQLAAGFASNASAIATDANGTVYAVGVGRDAQSVHWIVRRSADGGATWQTIDNYQLASGQEAHAQEVAVTPSGDVFVAGYAIGSGRSGQYWVVRRMLAGEAQFRTVDQFQYVSGKGAAAFALTVARSGAVYVGGRSTDKGGYVSMHVRLSTDNGASFSTIEASRFRLTTKGGATAHSIAVRSSATGSVAEDTVYVAGAADGANGYPRWIVREGKNGVYSTIRDWQSPSGLWSYAYALMVDSVGRVVVAGSYCYSAGNYRGRVETGSAGADGNASSWSAQDWTLADDYSGEDAATGLPVFANNGAFGLCELLDPLGFDSGIYVAGYGATRDGGEANFLVRKY
jgi:hypothetical protein